MTNEQLNTLEQLGRAGFQFSLSVIAAQREEEPVIIHRDFANLLLKYVIDYAKALGADVWIDDDGVVFIDHPELKKREAEKEKKRQEEQRRMRK